MRQPVIVLRRRLRFCASLRPASRSSCANAASLATYAGATQGDDSVRCFPRQDRGLNSDMRWALAGDRITTRGEVYRNASLRDLIEFTPRTGTVLRCFASRHPSNRGVTVHSCSLYAVRRLQVPR